MMRNRKILVICCVVFGIFFCASSQAEEKVGYINLQRLVNESKLGQSAKTDIQKLRRQKEATVAGKLRKINELRDLINKTGDKMTLQERSDKIEELQREYKEYQRLVADAKEDITREDRKLVSIILQRADSVLKMVAKQKKYTIILKDPNAIGYLDPRVDITDDVLKELNKKRSTKQSTKKKK